MMELNSVYGNCHCWNRALGIFIFHNLTEMLSLSFVKHVPSLTLEIFQNTGDINFRGGTARVKAGKNNKLLYFRYM